MVMSLGTQLSVTVLMSAKSRSTWTLSTSESDTAPGLNTTPEPGPPVGVTLPVMVWLTTTGLGDSGTVLEANPPVMVAGLAPLAATLKVALVTPTELRPKPEAAVMTSAGRVALKVNEVLIGVPLATWAGTLGMIEIGSCGVALKLAIEPARFDSSWAEVK